MTHLILLIDDDDSLRRVTEYNLTSGGFRVITAASGREGLVLFNENQPDLVVTDATGSLLQSRYVRTLGRPLPVALERLVELIYADNPITALEYGMFHFEYRTYPEVALREALMNALCHADFRLAGPILVKQYRDRLEISNPAKNPRADQT